MPELVGDVLDSILRPGGVFDVTFHLVDAPKAFHARDARQRIKPLPLP